MEQPHLTDAATAPARPYSPAAEEDSAAELEAILTEALHLVLGLPPDVAFARAREMTMHLRETIGGSQLYVPNVALRRRRQQRNAAIRAALKRGNARQVAAEFGVSVRTVYVAAAERP